jgi:antitoxin VapB
MEDERAVRLFREGGEQAIPISAEFGLDADEATIRREGGRLVIEPVPRSGLLAHLRTLEPLSEPFPGVEDEDTPLDEPDV